MKNLFNRFVREEEGQDIIEYVLLAAFISVVAWTIIQTIGSDVTDPVPGHPGRHGRSGGRPARHSVSDPRVTGGRPPAPACRFALAIIFVGRNGAEPRCVQTLNESLAVTTSG